MSLLDGLFGRKKQPQDTVPSDVYSDLRAQALASPPESVGAPSTGDCVFGVLMDIPVSGGHMATVVSMRDGTASLYTSTGGGIIGMGGHERPATAAKALVDEAERHRELFAAPWDDGALAAGTIRLIVLTPSGARSAVGAADRLMAGGPPLSPVFLAANNLMTEMRLASRG